MLWKNILPGDFRNAVEESKGLCIIPIGCVEAHGVHLPLGCDTIWGAGLVKEVAEREKVVVFPEIYFGEKSGAGEYPGTIIFPTTLIWQILEHSCYEIHRNGFHKILLVSSHGGNAAMLQAFVRQILQKKPEFNVYFYNLGLPKMAEMFDRPEEYPYLQESDWECLRDYRAQGKKGGHGCFRETGICYYVCPELCDLSKMNDKDGTSRHLFDEFTGHQIYTPFGWMGDYPDSLSADYHEGMNERIARAFAEYDMRFLSEAVRFLKEEQVSVEFHKQWLKKQK